MMAERHLSLGSNLLSSLSVYHIPALYGRASSDFVWEGDVGWGHHLEEVENSKARILVIVEKSTTKRTGFT